MSAVPVIERIALTLIERLEEIVVGNGYTFSVSSVDRINRDVGEWTPRNLGVAVAQGSTTENEAMTHEGNPAAIAYDTLFQIHGFVRHSDKIDDRPIDQATENAMDAAIKRAVAGTHDWHQFGGNAIDARWNRTSPFRTTEGDHAGITVGLLITYRISEDDPTISRA